MKKITTILLLALSLWAGTAGAEERFALAAINGNADLWTGFGNSGLMATTFPGFPGAVARDIKLDRYGRLLVAGDSEQGAFLLARYHASGALDTTFNSPYGWVATDLPGGQVGGLALFESGDIMVAGTSTLAFKRSPTFVRFAEHGALDTTFGGEGSGIVVLELDRSAELYDVAIRETKYVVSIVGAGSYFDHYNQINSGYLAIKLFGSGVPDPNFGNNGVAIHENLPAESPHYDNLEVAQAVAIDSRGRVVLGGYEDALAWGITVMTALRFKPNGTLDKSFTNGWVPGTVYAYFADDPHRENSQAFDVAIGPDDSVILVGRGWWVKDQFALARFVSDGRLDPSFDGNGITMTGFGWADAAIHGLSQAANGDLVVAGRVGTGTSKMAFARYRASDGALDPYFGNGGTLVLDFTCFGKEQLSAIAADHDDLFFAAGWSEGPPCTK